MIGLTAGSVANETEISLSVIGVIGWSSEIA